MPNFKTINHHVTIAMVYAIITITLAAKEISLATTWREKGKRKT